MTDRTPEEYRREARVKAELARSLIRVHLESRSDTMEDDIVDIVEAAILAFAAQRDQEHARHCTVCGATVVLVCAACKTVAAPLPDDWKAELITAASASALLSELRTAAQAHIEAVECMANRFICSFCSGGLDDEAESPDGANVYRHSDKCTWAAVRAVLEKIKKEC